MQNQVPIVAAPPQPGPPIQVLAPCPRPVDGPSLKNLGITEFVFGSVVIILSIVAVALTSQQQLYYYGYGYRDYNYYVEMMNPGQGIWGGIFVVATGFLAFRTLPTSSKCMYTANISMGIISSLVSLGAGMVSGWAAAAMMRYSTRIAILHVIVGLLTFVSMILCLVHACVSCNAARNNQIPTQQVAYAPQQGMVVLAGRPGGQQGPVFVQQPIAHHGQVFVQQPMAPQGQVFIQQPVGQHGQIFVQQPPGQQGQAFVPQHVVMQPYPPAPPTAQPIPNQDQNSIIDPVAAGENDQEKKDLPPDYSQQA